MVAQTQSRLAPWCLARSAIILLCCLLGGRQQHQSFTGGHTPASADVLRHILTGFAQVSPEAWVLSLEVKEWLWCGAEGFASPWGDQYVQTTTGECLQILHPGVMGWMLHSGASNLQKWLHSPKPKAETTFHSKQQGWAVLALSPWPYCLCFLQPSGNKRNMIICLLSPCQAVSPASPAAQEPQRFSQTTSKPCVRDTGHFIKQNQIISQSKATREVSVYRNLFTDVLINL